MEKFDLFIPAGTFCATSYHLRKAQLQTESLPFDWLNWVNLEPVVSFLATDFKDFLQLDQLKFLRKQGKSSIFEMPNRIKFVHDFMHEDPTIDFKEVRAKYDRRIERLLNKIKRSRRILFVHCREDNLEMAELLRIHAELFKLYPNKKIKLLYVHLV